jgi:hypothetical protein
LLWETPCCNCCSRYQGANHLQMIVWSTLSTSGLMQLRRRRLIDRWIQLFIQFLVGFFLLFSIVWPPLPEFTYRKRLQRRPKLHYLSL